MRFPLLMRFTALYLTFAKAFIFTVCRARKVIEGARNTHLVGQVTYISEDATYDMISKLLELSATVDKMKKAQYKRKDCS